MNPTLTKSSEEKSPAPPQTPSLEDLFARRPAWDSLSISEKIHINPSVVKQAVNNGDLPEPSEVLPYRTLGKGWPTEVIIGWIQKAEWYKERLRKEQKKTSRQDVMPLSDIFRKMDYYGAAAIHERTGIPLETIAEAESQGKLGIVREGNYKDSKTYYGHAIIGWITTNELPVTPDPFVLKVWRSKKDAEARKAEILKEEEAERHRQQFQFYIDAAKRSPAIVDFLAVMVQMKQQNQTIGEVLEIVSTVQSPAAESLPTA
jgi:hypothetical protein